MGFIVRIIGIERIKAFITPLMFLGAALVTADVLTGMGVPGPLNLIACVLAAAFIVWRLRIAWRQRASKSA